MISRNNIKSALIVLGGGRNDDGSLTALSMSRLDRALTSTADYIVVMGSKQKTHEQSNENHLLSGSEIRKDYLINKHISENRIIALDESCMDTIFEAFASRNIAENNNIQKIFLGTSLNHMNRALWIFRRIYSDNFQIFPIEDPCTDNLNTDLEKRILAITQSYFEKFPRYISFPNSWDKWYEEHRMFYKDIQKLVIDYKNTHGNYSQTHQTIFAKNQFK